MNYLYDVELITLNKIHNKYLDIDELKYQIFLESELNKKTKKNYDLDINIRDLYPLDVHTKNKKECDIELFNNLNKFVLSYDKRISRRITKKTIVYKKDRSRSILSVDITKTEHLKLFILSKQLKHDTKEKFVEISLNSKMPFKSCMTINDNNDLKYAIKLLKKYLNYELR